MSVAMVRGQPRARRSGTQLRRRRAECHRGSGGGEAEGAVETPTAAPRGLGHEAEAQDLHGRHLPPTGSRPAPVPALGRLEMADLCRASKGLKLTNPQTGLVLDINGKSISADPKVTTAWSGNANSQSWAALP